MFKSKRFRILENLQQNLRYGSGNMLNGMALMLRLNI